MEHCHKVNDEANKMAMIIEKQYLKKNPITEDCGFMDRVGHYNIAKGVAEEIVLSEIIFSC